jgi:hypothetical protein
MKFSNTRETQAMNIVTAEQLAKEYLIEHLAKNLQLTLHKGSPRGFGIYNFNSADEYLFTYSFGFTPMLRGSKYVSVSRITGKVRDHGVCGD